LCGARPLPGDRESGWGESGASLLAEKRSARRRTGHGRAVGRPILVIVWYLLADTTVHYQDLGPGFYDTRVNAERTKRNHVRQLERSATSSPSNPRLTRIHQPGLDPAPLRCTGCCRLPTPTLDYRTRR
jgi:hypothetical protein